MDRKEDDDPLAGAAPVLDRFRLDGRIALVTGAGQGIGRGFAHALGEAGAKVAVNDLYPERAERVADELSNKGIEAIPIAADVTRKDEVDDMVSRVVDEWGSLTIGVNNAGLCIWSDAETMPLDVWDKTMNLNLRGVMLCAQAEAKVMLAKGYGKIINTASISGTIINTPQNQAAYNVSKAGVIHLTRSLAAEWAGRGVRVNCISPGYTRTRLVEDLLATPEGEKVLLRWLSMTPTGKMIEVTDLQGAVVFLASAASDAITGQDIVVDGGYTCW